MIREGSKYTQLSENPTMEEIIKASIPYWKESWVTGYNYTSDSYVTHSGKHVENKVLENIQYLKNIFYAIRIFDLMDIGRWDDRIKAGLEELYRWDKKGGACIYISVLLACLFEFDCIYNDNDIQLIQGAYHHLLKTDFPKIIPMGKHQAGIHAFLSCNGSIFDIGIMSQRCFFDFPNSKDYVIGHVPQGLDLCGFPEDFKTIKTYARQIAKESGTFYNEWIKTHSLTASRYMISCIDEAKDK